ncbi:helix-turn-helix transcriptional regulator [Corynebacterium sp. AOP12-C2-36]|uniref:helix-turn-helix transcriptional regulator n=1 Tax=Corynebacterium sp. AOP12-C2-36 TaxID=3457723 RepID=UPI0040347670
MTATFKPARERQIDAALYEVGEAVAQRRRLERLTQATLAKRAHVSRSTITRIESGDPGVRVGLLVAVLQALGIRDVLTSALSVQQDPRATASALESLPKRGRI